MKEIAIEVSNLSKRYVLPKPSAKWGGPFSKENAAPHVAAEQGSNSARTTTTNDERIFWALKNVNFTVARGERVALIGANGAGKSTLLKILSRVTPPSEGFAKIRGQLGSLLEVGTGFKDSLTGRDNVFLNASVMGFSREYIQDRLQEILEFSELGDFIDVPIKNYSSGMKSRLAFSVATYLSSDILLLDEVLSVGDIAFRQKCLQRIEDMMSEGQTIVFVSHSMGSVLKFCETAIWLDKGQIRFHGRASECVRLYEDEVLERKGKIFDRSRERSASGMASVKSIDLIGPADIPPMHGQTGAPLAVRIAYRLAGTVEPITSVQANVVFYNEKGQLLFGLPSDAANLKPEAILSLGTLEFRIERLPLVPGVYRVQFGLLINDRSDEKVVAAERLVVLEGDYFSTGKLPPTRFGNICVDFVLTYYVKV